MLPIIDRSRLRGNLVVNRMSAVPAADRGPRRTGAHCGGHLVIHRRGNLVVDGAHDHGNLIFIRAWGGGHLIDRRLGSERSRR